MPARNPSTVDRKRFSPCAYCGAMVPGGSEGCLELLRQVPALEYSVAAYGAVNLLTTDAYALQHPEHSGVKNSPFHLIRLCWLLEHGGDTRLGRGPRWLQVQFDGKPELPDLEPPAPAHRGTVTITDVYGSETPAAHGERVYRWATSVWEAWSDHHEWARQWLSRSRGTGDRGRAICDSTQVGVRVRNEEEDREQ